MLPEAMSKSKTVRRSLTDRILTLCISGRFGLQEAIAEAIRQEGKTNRTLANGIGAELCRRRAAKETPLVIAGLDEAKEELKEMEVEDILERAHRQVRELLTAKKSSLE